MVARDCIICRYVGLQPSGGLRGYCRWGKQPFHTLSDRNIQYLLNMPVQNERQRTMEAIKAHVSYANKAHLHQALVLYLLGQINT